MKKFTALALAGAFVLIERSYMRFEFCCPTLFGLEGIVADELRFEGKIEDVRAENGRVFFSGDEHTLAWANLHLRCAERVLIRVAAFQASTFTELFDQVHAVRWEDLMDVHTAFPVKGWSLDSQLASVPTCQKMIKKAIVSRLGEAYGVSWFPEDGALMQVQFSLHKDQCDIFLDTSGSGLHKRGYRANSNAAPLRETLAAAMLKVARWRGRDPLIDPFCGSGTIPIEAAMIAMNRAPGLMRSFDSEKWPVIGAEVWACKREEAIAAIRHDAEPVILGCDIDPECTQLSRENARKAGVEALIDFDTRDALSLPLARMNGVLFANPPYGERMLDRETAQRLYTGLGRLAGKSNLRQYYLTSDPDFEKYYGYCADKKRKLYNGMLKCDLYMYFKRPEDRKIFKKNQK